MIGLYVDADSPVHRLPAGPKIVALLVFGTLLFLLSSWATLAIGAALVAIGFAIAGLDVAKAAEALRPLLWIFAFILVVQAVFGDWLEGIHAVLRFAVLVLAAALLTFTTRISDFVSAIEAALSRGPAWIPAEKIALAIALALRFIPRIAQIYDEIRAAQHARGLERSMTALAVPLIVRTLRDADDIARAIEARSVD